jgi:hypothetical protein
MVGVGAAAGCGGVHGLLRAVLGLRHLHTEREIRVGLGEDDD